MPFTFSHPAIVFPLHALPKPWRSMTGLIAGSIVPDFEMFLKMKAETSFSHTLSGVFWFNLPLAFLLACLYHLLIRDVLITHLPSFLRLRFNSFKNFNWIAYCRKNFLAVILSVLVGACLHILWDGFTHKNGLFVKLLPFLQTPVELASFTSPLYYLLQLGFSVLGAVVMVVSVFLLPVQHDQFPKKNKATYWVMLVILAAPVFVIGMQQEFTSHYLSNVVVNAISALLIGLLLTSVYFRYANKTTPVL
ncbi:DUF4184 family protein [Pontibacter qinzhouensis]|uniref:DUF4184 family protein n=1 Tax=Pontibacter qinzhouensis TaxID=2603253 RepID=A0A5C8JHB5_9BACT|nr:DUF4184 family protein [Pontibacter qinzhouensis]TXK37018.1 DUF4184 family protein [Pontibacter qinzhouensis]